MTKQNGKTAIRNIDAKKHPIKMSGDWVAMIQEGSSIKIEHIIMPEGAAEKFKVSRVVAVGPDADIGLLHERVFYNYTNVHTMVKYGNFKYYIVPSSWVQGVFTDKPKEPKIVILTK